MPCYFYLKKLELDTQATMVIKYPTSLDFDATPTKGEDQYVQSMGRYES